MPLLYGDMITLAADKDMWVFARMYMGQYVVVAFNNSSEPQTAEFALPACFPAPKNVCQHFGGSVELKGDGTMTVGVGGNSFNIISVN